MTHYDEKFFERVGLPRGAGEALSIADAVTAAIEEKLPASAAYAQWPIKVQADGSFILEVRIRTMESRRRAEILSRPHPDLVQHITDEDDAA